MNRLLRIDEYLRPDHNYLSAEDECYYLMNYTPRKPANFNNENQLINNFKKHPKHRGTNHWHYKEGAIEQVCGLFAQAVRPLINVTNTTLVPIPPSKTKAHTFYDDRMVQVLQKTFGSQGADVRELLVMLTDMEPMHLSNSPRSAEDLYRNMTVDYSIQAQVRQNVVLFDDMITTGSHYAACKRHITEQFPGRVIAGIFISRRDPENFLDIFDLV